MPRVWLLELRMMGGTMMSLLAYLLAIGAWVGIVEALLHRWRRRQYEEMDAMRAEAEAMLREARLARLRMGASLRTMAGGAERRAS